ncbi:VWA domain-containing protein [uncultured Anaerofustis sp.]|uniref:VWA domain-containing protein n=1 Tax=uncultured Anaerofustis sp. TaxID=904996 RepID=UPI0025F05495|nr:VWA domain-containing protein [uncultured Anaerofustis sp.]
MKKNLLSFLLFIIFLLSTQTSIFAAENNYLNKSKSAEELKNDKTTITLSLKANEVKTYSDVVFVLDKSTSTNVKNEALKMLQELNKNAQNHKIKVGIIIFNKQAHNILELTELNNDNLKTIEKAINTKISSGTNLEAGIRAGRKMLDSDNKVENKNKHLVIVSDGVTYLWSDEPKTVFNENNNTGEENIYCGPDIGQLKKNHKDIESYLDELKDCKSWMNKYKESYETTIKTYTDIYDGQTLYSYNPDEDYSKKYVPADNRENNGYSTDIAMYTAAKEYEKAVNNGYDCFSYGSTDQLSDHPYGLNFMLGLSSLGGISKKYDDNASGVEGMFDNVKSDILYTIEKGKITDLIGKDFDLISNSFKLYIGNKELKSTINDKQEICFGDKDKDGIYPYVIEYINKPEKFILSINTPVKKTEKLELKYQVKLINKSDKEGEHIAYTNEEAYIDYTSTDGKEKQEYFNKPHIKYIVNKTNPKNIENQKKEIINKEKTTKTPQTGDTNDNYIYSIIMLISLAGLGSILYKLKKSF